MCHPSSELSCVVCPSPAACADWWGVWKSIRNWKHKVSAWEKKIWINVILKSHHFWFYFWTKLNVLLIEAALEVKKKKSVDTLHQYLHAAVRDSTLLGRIWTFWNLIEINIESHIWKAPVMTNQSSKLLLTNFMSVNYLSNELIFFSSTHI